MSIQANLAAVEARIVEACHRGGRPRDSVQLVVVSKTVPIERIRQAVAAGARLLGESRIQEARGKIETMGRPVPWHLIGHLQRNKARDAVRLFDVIHSVDSERLVGELERRAAEAEVTLAILLQVNVSGESAKFGCSPQAVEPLALAADKAPHLTLRGLMTIPPWNPSAEAARPHYRRLRRLRDELTAAHSELDLGHLSMGMTHDFEVAIEEGATLVRIGTALFT